MLVLMLVALSLPVVLGIPDKEPTKEEQEKMIEKIKYNAGLKGYMNIPNRHQNPPDDDDDIAPELKQRYQYGLSNKFNTKYSIDSSNPNPFTDSWTDRFTLDNDHSEWPKCIKNHVNEQISYGDTMYWTGDYTAEGSGHYYDMNIYVDIYDGIRYYEGDSNIDNNKDWEYMYFWYIGG